MQQLVCEGQPLDWQTHVKSHLDATYHLDLDAKRGREASQHAQRSTESSQWCHCIAQGFSKLHAPTGKASLQQFQSPEFWGAANHNRWRTWSRQKSPWLDAPGLLRACMSRPNQDAHRWRTIDLDLPFHQPPTHRLWCNHSIRHSKKDLQDILAAMRRSTSDSESGWCSSSTQSCQTIIITERNIFEAERMWSGDDVGLDKGDVKWICWRSCEVEFM